MDLLNLVGEDLGAPLGVAAITWAVLELLLKDVVGNLTGGKTGRWYKAGVNLSALLVAEGLSLAWVLIFVGAGAESILNGVITGLVATFAATYGDQIFKNTLRLSANPN